MIRSFVTVTLVLAATVAEARTKIVDLEGIRIPPGLSLEQVEEAIVSGSADRGWTPKVIKAGHVEAHLYIRTHTAVVDIVFNTSAYSITYKESSNLDYKNHKIHRNYNRWVANLNQALQRSLARNPHISPREDQSSSGPVSSPSIPAASALGVYAGETVTIPSSVRLADTVQVPPAFSECDTRAELSRMLQEHAPKVQIGTVPAAGHYMDLAITELHMPGGGAWSGPKWLEVTGSLREADGDVVAAFRAKRFSTGGAFGVFKGNCAIVRRCANAIAVDIAGWLRKPFDGAELGDAR